MKRLLALAICCVPALTNAMTWTDVDGVVCIEIEGQPANGKWVSETSEAGYSSGGYYRFDNNRSTGVIGYSNSQAMTYTINIKEAGNYQFLAKGLISYGGQRGEHNDAWVKMSGEPIDGEHTIGKDSSVKFYLSNFGWTYHSATKDDDQQPIRQYFSAGLHTVSIAGRSSEYCIDRFMLIHESRWDELLRSGSKWNDNPSWGRKTATLDAIVETLNSGGANTAPIVDAGSNKSLPTAVSTVQLDGDVVDDGDFSVAWTQTSGPSATITSPASEDTNVTLSSTGTYVFRLTADDGEFSVSDEITVTRYEAGEDGPLKGQIMVDPVRGNFLVRNQDLDGDGSLDPFMMAGVGGPEQFLYLGSRQSNGTRSGGRQQEIIDELIASGANGIYLQSIRSFGGDAGKDKTQAPFNDYNDPDSGLDPEIMAQWHGWFSQMRDADIGILFFIYDDHAKPWGSKGDSVPSGEQAFIKDIVNEFEDYPNIIFVIAEEYQFAGFSVDRVSNMAAVVASADDHDHAIGVHHNIGLSNQFIGDPNINLYVQQADLRNGSESDKIDDLRETYGIGQGFDEGGRYAYIMGEGFGLHQDLVGRSNKRDALRKSMYATAMTGSGLTVFGAYEANWGRDPLKENLEDMGRLVEFFHTTPFHTMAPNDGLAHGNTDWVLADQVNHRYIAYSDSKPSNMGVKDLPDGTYELRWFDAKDGDWVIQTDLAASGDTAFAAPSAMSNDTVVEIILQSQTGGPSNAAPLALLSTSATTGEAPFVVSFDASNSSDPDGDTISYIWNFGSGGFSGGKTETFTFRDAGVYEVTLYVNDGELDSSVVKETITVVENDPVDPDPIDPDPTPVNTAPTASFTADVLSGNAPLVVNFDASASSDAEGDSLSYFWDFGDGAGFDQGAFAEEVVFEEAGEFTVSLQVDDGELRSEVVSLVVTVVESVREGELIYAINCGGQAYTDSDGVVYEADNYFVGGNSWSVGHVIANTEDQVLLRTERYNKAPGAVDYAFPVESGRYEVTMTWSENTAKGLRIMDVSAEGELMLDNLDVVSASGGKRTAYRDSFEVTVNDGQLNLSIASDQTARERFPNVMAITVKLLADNPLVADFVADVTSGKAPLVVQFDASSSSFAESDVVYLWDFDDGEGFVEGSVSESATFVVEGSYEVRLKINDGESESPIASETISVEEGDSSGAVLYAINCGGSAYTDANGLNYLADSYFTNGSEWSVGHQISDTDDQAVYRTERYNKAPRTVDYSFPVEAGSYIITMMWSENTAKRPRIMDIYSEGQLVIDNLDVASLSGGRRSAHEERFIVDVADGSLDLKVGVDAAAGERYPNVMGIIIESME